MQTLLLTLGLATLAAAAPIPAGAPCIPKGGCATVEATLPASPGGGSGGAWASPGNSNGQPVIAPRVWDEDRSYDDYMGDATWNPGPPETVSAEFCADVDGVITMSPGDPNYTDDDPDGILEVYVMVPWWVYETFLVGDHWEYGWVLHWSKKGPVDVAPC